MDDLIESQRGLVLEEFSQDDKFEVGSEPEGETGLHASSIFREIDEENAGAGNDSVQSLTERGKSIMDILDVSIARSNDLLLRRGIFQPPTIFKLSDELLGMISIFITEPQLAEPPSTTCKQPLFKRRQRNKEFEESAKTIQSLLLVCRRFCNVSSPFLLPTVHVEMNAQSLARLDMISRHPTIGKGVRTVTVINRFLNYTFDSFEKFHRLKTKYLYCSLDMVISDAVPADEGGESRMSRELYRRYILDRSGGSVNERILRQIFWEKAYERYKHFVVEQESITEEDVFLEGVGTAVARMPRATTLHISDRGRDYFHKGRPRPRLCSTSKFLFNYCENEDVLIDDIIKSKLFGYEDDFELHFRADKGWTSPPAQVLLKLPGAIYKAGRSLENIFVEIKPPRGSNTLTSSEDFKKLSAATQRLKHFTFCYRWTYIEEDDEWSPRELNGLVRYLSAIVNTNALEKIEINMELIPLELRHLDMEKRALLAPSLGAVFTSRIWPNLRSICLSQIPLHLSELETFIDNLKSSDIVMHIKDMYLINGSWSDGFEVFKRNSIQNLVLEEPFSVLECRALLFSGKLFWDWDQKQYYWDFGDSIKETTTGGY
ncbi:hypothetical protein BOTCAL_0181g00030 [Botryotinia calthae]|uniref:Uncharacterized protein n=1 Tax=Botryotinia calthae TaxID=38488 RepID=A0A4Y8D2W7_9HELO|nr:hypothetical protein BOTCAL_0181g00030 [Botryotinia calthae]